MNIKRILALCAAAVSLSALAVGCKKKEPLVQELGGTPTDLAATQLATEAPLVGAYTQDIPPYSTGNPTIDEDYQRQLKDLSSRFQEGYLPEQGDYFFHPTTEKIETDNYVSLIANVGTKQDHFFPFTYRKQTGALVKLEDVLSQPDYANLPALVKQGMKSDAMLADADTDSEMFVSNVTQPNGFAVDHNGILLYYAPLRIVPAIHGTPVIRIPLDALSAPLR